MVILKKRAEQWFECFLLKKEKNERKKAKQWN